MRVLTVRQPWAWAIIHGGKDVENRVRNIAGSYRGPVAIHAGLQFDYETPTDRMLADYSRRPATGRETGAIIGVVDLTDVHDGADCYGKSIQHAAHLWRTDREAYYALPTSGHTAGGLQSRGHFCSPWAMDEHLHLTLANPRALAEPIPFKGALGLRTLDNETTERILEGIA